MSRKKKLIYGFVFFLLAMLMFYLVSRGIYAKNLAQVDVASPEVMSLSHSVKVVGNVSSGSETAVFVSVGLPISQVQVRLGEQVEAGDVLFTCDLEKLSELVQEEELELSKIELQLQALAKNVQLQKEKKEKQENRAGEDYQNTLESVETNVKWAQEDVSLAEEQLKLHENSPVQVTAEEERKQRQEAYQAYLARLQQAENSQNSATAKVNTCRSQIQDKETEITLLKQDILELENGQTGDQVSSGDGTSSLLEQNRAALREAENALEMLKEELANALLAEATAKQALLELTQNPVEKPDFSGEDSAKKQWDAAKSSLEQNSQAAGRGLENANMAKEEAVKNASRAVEDAKEELPADATYETMSLELDAREEQLKEHQELLENEGRVLAKQGGLITGVNISAGGWTSSQAAFLLADTEKAFFFEAHLSKDQKQYVSRNMQATIVLDEVEAYKGKVDYLTESSLKDGSFDVAVCLEEGVGNPGQGGMMETSMQTEIYGCCVPLDALYQDNTFRNYVYVLVETEGILGTELSVRKQIVRVLDQNDRYAALEPGELDADEKVVIYTTKELGEGDIVRMHK